MKKNFELERNFHRRIREYADFLNVSDKDLMQILLVYGLNEYENCKDSIPIIKTTSAFELKEKQKENRREYYKKIFLQEDIEQEDAIFDAKLDIREKINKLRIRCKIHISEKTNEILKTMVREINEASTEKYTDSDIIYSLLHYSMYKELDFLRLQYFWKADLINDPEYNAPIKIQMQLPRIIYNSLTQNAAIFDISTSDYIQLKLLDDFIETNRRKLKNNENETDT